MSKDPIEMYNRAKRENKYIQFNHYYEWILHDIRKSLKQISPTESHEEFKIVNIIKNENET